jgi:hypothetical protein
MAPKGKGRGRKKSAGAHGGGAQDPALENAEAIGSQLWAAFAHGAQIPRVPLEVVRLGRRLSGPHVLENVENLLADSKLMARTLGCAERVGALARDKMPESDPPTVDEVAFADAWQQVADEQKETLERLRSIFGIQRILGGAC